MAIIIRHHLAGVKQSHRAVFQERGAHSLGTSAGLVLELAYHEIGSGPALVFLPGLGGDRRAFTGAARHFASCCRVIAVDLRDAGQSPRVERAYTLADVAADVVALLHRLGIARAHVVGHSLGGMVAQELALGHPDRVASLVLASTHAGADAWRRAVVESWISTRRLMDAAEFTRCTLPWLAAPGFYQRWPAQVAGLIRFAEGNQHLQDAEAFERQARASLGHDTRDRLSQIRVPCLVISGGDDIVNRPEAARSLAEGLPYCQLRILEGVGHLPHVEEPALFVSVIEEFLGPINKV